MSDLSPERGADTPPGVPRWVMVFGIIALVLVLLFTAMHLLGGGSPARHSSPGSLGEPAISVALAKLP